MDDEADDGERTSRKPGHDERCGQSGFGMLTRTRSMRLRHVECTAKPREPGPGCGSAGRGRARFGDACRTFGRTSVKGTMKLNGRSRFARTYGRGRRRGGGLLRSRRPRGRDIAPVKRRPHGRKVLHRGVSAEWGGGRVGRKFAGAARLPRQIEKKAHGTKNPSLRRAMLLCPAAAAAASARWVRCRASTSGPEEPPRAPVTRVRRRRRLTREGTSDPSRPEPSEVSGADKDARARPSRRRDARREARRAVRVDHSAGAGAAVAIAVAVASAVGRGPRLGSTRPGASTPPSRPRARWRNFATSWRRTTTRGASTW